MTNDAQILETHFDRLDREKQAQEADYQKTLLIEQQQTKRAKLKARESTKEMLVRVGALIAGAAVLITLAIVFWTDVGEDPDQQPKVSHSEREQMREERCVDTGGGWVPSETFNNAYPKNGMCIYPGKPVEKVEE